MALFFAVISHLGWAVGDVFGVTATRKMGSVSMTVWRGTAGFFLASIFLLPFFWKDFFRLTPEMLLMIAGLTVLTLIADFAFFEGIKVGNPTVVGVISASFVAISVIISVVFLGEHITLEKAGVVSMIIFGVILCLFDKNSFTCSWKRGEFMALAAMVGWGVYYAYIKIPVRSVGWFVPSYLFLLTLPVIGLFLRSRNHFLQSPFPKRIFPIFFISVLLTMIAEWGYNIAIETSDVSFVAPIAGSYPALFVLLSSLIFKEKMHMLQWIGVGTTLAGIVILGTL